LDLLGRHEAALQKAREALELAGRTTEGREAYVIAGIAAARLGRTEEARKTLDLARQLGSPFAERNLSALADRHEGEVPADHAGQTPLRPERIGGLNIAEIRLSDLLSDPEANVLARWEADEDMPGLQIVKVLRGSAQALVILRGAAAKRSAAVVLSDSMMAGSKAALARGLPVKGVEAQFGSPSSVALTRQGRYYLYEGHYKHSLVGLMIRLDADRVLNWASYRIDE
jgi:hypothetical protein